MTNWEKHETALKELWENNAGSLTVDMVMGYLYEQGMLANPVEAIVRQGASQPVFACGRCVECEYYEKIDDTEVQHEETFWETCHHPDINEMLCWDCEKIGCTEFKKRASKSA